MCRVALTPLFLAFVAVFGLSCGGDPRPTGTYILESTPIFTSNCERDFQDWLIQYAGAIRPGSAIEIDRIGKNSIDVQFEANVDVLLNSTDREVGFYSGSIFDSFEVEGCLVTEELVVDAYDGENFLEIFAREFWTIEPVKDRCIWFAGDCNSSYEFFANKL